MLSFCRSHRTDLQSLSMIDKKKTRGVGGLNCFQLPTVVAAEKVWKAPAQDYQDFYQRGTKMACTPTRPGVKGPSVSGSLRNSLSTLWFLVSFGRSSLHPPPVHSKGTRLCVYIYISASEPLSAVKSRRWTCPLGKSLALRFTASGLSLLLLRRGRSAPFFSLLPHFLTLALQFLFFFFFGFTGIPDLVIDPNVNYYKPRHTDTAGFSASMYKKKQLFPNHSWVFLSVFFILSLSFFIIFISSAWLMTHLWGL